jgi:hypothetical protein
MFWQEAWNLRDILSFETVSILHQHVTSGYQINDFEGRVSNRAEKKSKLRSSRRDWLQLQIGSQPSHRFCRHVKAQ